MTAAGQPEYTLSFVCPDQLGIVCAVSNWLFQHDCNIIDSDQFGVPFSNKFFVRVHLSGDVSEPALRTSFAAAARPRDIDWRVWPAAEGPIIEQGVERVDHRRAPGVFACANR